MLCGDQKASCPLAPPGPGQPGGELSCQTPVSADADAGRAFSAAGWAQVGVCGRRETSAVLTEAAAGVKCAAGRLGGTCGTQPGPCQAPRGPPCGPVVKCTCLRLPAGEKAQGGPQGAAPGPAAGSARGSVSWRWERRHPAPAADRNAPGQQLLRYQHQPAQCPRGHWRGRRYLKLPTWMEREASGLWGRPGASALGRPPLLRTRRASWLWETQRLSPAPSPAQLLYQVRGCGVTTKFIPVCRGQVGTGHRDDGCVQTARQRTSVYPCHGRVRGGGGPTACPRSGQEVTVSPGKDVFLSSPSESKHTVPRGTNRKRPPPGITTNAHALEPPLPPLVNCPLRPC